MATREAASKLKTPVVVSTSPDLCKRGKSIVAYNIIGIEEDDAKPSPDVNFKSAKASNLKTRLSTCYGDEQGDRGIRSGCIKGWCRPIDDLSPTVQVNGQPTVREGTLYEMNCNGPDGPANTEGILIYLTNAPLSVINQEGEVVGETDPPPEPDAVKATENAKLDQQAPDAQVDADIAATDGQGLQNDVQTGQGYDWSDTAPPDDLDAYGNDVYDPSQNVLPGEQTPGRLPGASDLGGGPAALADPSQGNLAPGDLLTGMSGTDLSQPSQLSQFGDTVFTNVVVEPVTGIYNAVTSPVQTATSIYDGAASIVTDPIGAAVGAYDGIVGKINEIDALFASGQTGKAWGEITSIAAELLPTSRAKMLGRAGGAADGADAVKGVDKNAPDGQGQDSASGGGANSGQGDGATVRGKGGGDDADPDSDKKACSCKPVDMITGEVIKFREDLALPGAIPFSFQRSYRQGHRHRPSSFGKGWWCDWEQFIAYEQDQPAAGLPPRQILALRTDEGRTARFRPVGVGERYVNRYERQEIVGTEEGFEVRSLDARLSRCFVWAGERARLVSLRDDCGNAISLHYAGEQLARIDDTAGRRIIITRSAEGLIIRVAVYRPGDGDAIGEGQDALIHFDYAYDAAGRLISTTDALGQSEHYAYDDADRMVSITDANGLVNRYTYDDQERVIHTVADGGLFEVRLAYEDRQSFKYDTPEPRRYVADERNFIILEQDPSGRFQVRNKYDADHLLIAEGDASGEVTRYQYDERGLLIAETDAAGNETRWCRVNDLPVQRNNPDGTMTLYRHDERGLLTSVVSPTGVETNFAYNEHGRLSRIRRADRTLFDYRYDAQHNLVEVRTLRGGVTRYRYDALGRPLARVDALGRETTVQYDAIGRIEHMRFADGTSVSYGYNALGNLTEATDALDQTTRFEWEGIDALKAVHEPDGHSWHFENDSDGKTLAVINPLSERYAYRYDEAGRMIEERPFDGRILQYRYNLSGEVETLVRTGGQERSFEYDALGLLLLERSGEQSIKIRRDRLGRVEETAVVEAGGEVLMRFERDPLGRVIAEIQDGQRIEYSYDELNRRLTRTLPGEQRTRYCYDPLGALAELYHNGHHSRFERDVLGRLAGRHSDGVAELLQYDDVDRLIEQRLERPGKSGARRLLHQRSYGYDAGGRLTRIFDRRWGEVRYAYDATGNLLSARRGPHEEIFGYDGAGSLRRLARGLAPLNQSEDWLPARPGNLLLSDGEAQYRYDEHGRRIEKRSQGAVTRYRWDERDRLRQVELPGGGKVRYRYDAFGRRVHKEVLAPDGGEPGARTMFLWDGDALCAELDEGETGRIHVHMPGTLLPLLQVQDGEVLTVSCDHLGMPKELVDGRGRIAWSAAHDAWGRVVEVWRDEAYGEEGPASPFRLYGQHTDDDVDLCVTRFRYFDPVLGRWLRPDPLGLLGGRDLQGFNGAAQNAIDPFGLKCSCREEMRERLGEDQDVGKGYREHEIDTAMRMEEEGLGEVVGPGKANDIRYVPEGKTLQVDASLKSVGINPNIHKDWDAVAKGLGALTRNEHIIIDVAAASASDALLTQQFVYNVANRVGVHPSQIFFVGMP